MLRARLALSIGLGILLAAAVGIALSRRIERDLEMERNLHRSAFVGSDDCKRCHPGHYESWARTYHRRMTQEASTETVLGRFDGSTLTYRGVQAIFRRDPYGRYTMTFARPDGTEERVIVARTVGSHRYQQYLARDSSGLYLRLPVAWDVERERWIHMNGAFLTPDPPEIRPGVAVARADYERHVAPWNDNCIFCHNVAPTPD